jgi:cbb3-type cytochrome oxidase subunit 3
VWRKSRTENHKNLQEIDMSQFLETFSAYGLYLGIPLLFLAIVAWVYRPGAKKRYQADGNLPFYGDKKPRK